MQARIENAKFLLEAGYHPSEVARRLGLTPDNLQKMMERHS